MAEESHYAADNKRKYDDSQALPSRRPTGFSAPISSLSPTDASSAGQQTVSYNSVPPPMDEIQLAKQKAQEIAARLYSSAEAAKKPRVENGSGGGYDANEGMYQKPFASSAPPPVSSYGYSSTSKKIEVPNGRVGVIIGKGGETIKYLQLQSGAKIQVTRDMDADPNSPNRAVELMGTPEQISKAEQLIQDVLAEASAGGSGVVSRRTGEQGGSDKFVMIVPNNKVGLVIGKGGETIKNMQARTGARIQVIPLHLPPGDTSAERTVQIDGTSEQIEAAKQLVNEVIMENRMRNQGMSGSYPQQGYQARPQTSWAPPGAPMQQPGYGYLQPGAYPGSAPQYNPNQPPYPGYPPQPTSGGYATGWDQTTAPSNQQPVQGGGYDYYGQQPPQHQQPAAGGPAAPAENSGYAYNQPPAAGYNQGQAYSQDVYGGYNAPAPQSGYGQPQPNPAGGYDQQQSYNSVPGYANASNPPPDGHTPYGTQGDGSQVPPGQSSSAGQQSYPTGQVPSPKPGYPPHGSSQPGYGVPPTSQGGYGTQPPGAYGQGYAPPQQVQKPPSSQPTYGQPQQSPTAQGGYDQPGYPPVQSTYAQPDPAGQQQPPTGYGPPSAQMGYGAPPYGAPPPNYGQPQAPLYGANYGGGYSQPQAYSGDGSSGGNARGTSDSTPSQAAVQPSGTAKASPPS